MGIVSVLVQAFLIGKISKRYGESKTFKLGLLFMTAAIFIMPFSPAVAFLALTIIALSIGSALARPTLNSVISKSAVEGQGTTMGISVSFEAIGRILGPVTGGYLFQKFYGFGSFWIPALVIFGFLILIKVMDSRKQNKNRVF